LALFGLLYGASALSNDTNDILVKKQWEDWKIQFGKTYSTQEEEYSRFNNFLNSIDRVSHRNINAVNQVFGLTKFSDMSVEEFKGTMLTYRPTKNQGDERKGPRDGKDGKDGKDGENGKQEPPHQG